MTEVTNGNPARHVTANACCPKHVALVENILAFWANVIREASKTTDTERRFSSIEACVYVGAKEVVQALQLPCERLSSSKAVHGETAEDEKEIADIARLQFFAFEDVARFLREA